MKRKRAAPARLVTAGAQLINIGNLVTAKTISAGIEDQKFRLRWTLPQSHGPPVAIRIDSALLNCSTV
jgi:hypothetical protein